VAVTQKTKKWGGLSSEASDTDDAKVSKKDKRKGEAQAIRFLKRVCISKCFWVWRCFRQVFFSTCKERQEGIQEG
jgi:hypothetical protein